jgi:hypothetical protein
MVTKEEFNKLLVKILPTMIESRFNLFQVHREVILRDSPIVIQNVLGVTPESFNPIDMILSSLVHLRL